MTDPDDMDKTTVRYQLMAVARDVLTLSAVLTIIGGAFWAVANPYLKPFLELPEKVAEINARLAPLSTPHLVEFNGAGIVVNEPTEFYAGDTVRIMYNMRRNADCTTQVEYSFINVDTGTKVTTNTGRSVNAPVTEDFTYFILSLNIPRNLAPGRYSYFPRIVPLNCGIYKPFNGAMSDLFTVERHDRAN